jgi:hypothetical protein
VRTFACRCGNRLFFDNTRCLACGRDLGFVPSTGELVAIEGDDTGGWRGLHPALEGQGLRRCRNYRREAVCNWMVPESEDYAYCQACRLNQAIPDLSHPNHRLYWRRIEEAKRRLVYALNELRLPVFSKLHDPERGLGFAFLADAQPQPEFSDRLGGSSRVLTGHNSGRITINIAEADDVEREKMRSEMGERYRTLLGHFRHEIGHYYWLLMVQGTVHEAPFRELFGDERANYGEALERYYRDGPPPDWSGRFISRYASAHPWEDWAECFAHYLHMFDALESAAQFGYATVDLADRSEQGLERWLSAWIELTVGLNELNRCMGQPDLYPFVLAPATRRKLTFIHRVLAENAGRYISVLSAVSGRY